MSAIVTVDENLGERESKVLVLDLEKINYKLVKAMHPFYAFKNASEKLMETEKIENDIKEVKNVKSVKGFNSSSEAGYRLQHVDALLNL